MSIAMQNPRRPCIFSPVLKPDKIEERFRGKNIGIFFILFNEYRLNSEKFIFINIKLLKKNIFSVETMRKKKNPVKSRKVCNSFSVSSNKKNLGHFDPCLINFNLDFLSMFCPFPKYPANCFFI